MTGRRTDGTLGWVSAALGCVLLALSGVMTGGVLLANEPSDPDTAAASLELVELRSELESSSLDLLVRRMLVAVDVPGDHDARALHAADSLAAALDDLEELSERRDVVGWEAGGLLEEFDPPAHHPSTFDTDDLFAIADGARWAAVSAPPVPEIAAQFELSFVEVLPWHILIEAIAGMVDVADLPVAPAEAEFVDDVTSVVRSEGGWLAVDAPTTLADSPWFDLATARRLLPRATERVEAAFAASDLVIVDRWALELGQSDTPPPSNPAQAARWADELHADIAPVIDAAGDTTLAAVEVQRRSDGVAPWVWLSLAGVLALGATLLLTLGVREIRRAARVDAERAELAVLDALTGVGNRHGLVDLERALDDDSRLDHHVVAIVDLDRFKMVNDLHGHAAGDEVLVRVAKLLSMAADDVAGATRPSEHAVIRLGGDEFLVAIHSEHPVDEARLRGQLDLARQVVVTVGSAAIPIEFSLGIAVSTGRCELDALMRAADLAVYQDKSARAEQRRASAPMQPSPAR